MRAHSRRLSAVWAVLLGCIPAAPTAVALERPAAPLPAAAPALKTVLARAETLLNQGRAAEAYAVLAPSETRFAGLPRFDYALGAAAVDAGYNDQAVLILQRVLLVEPAHLPARMELGRAYFNLGDLELAEREFRLLQQANPPPFAARVIDDYLARIDRGRTAYSRQLKLHTQLEAGFNSNANGGTDSSRFVNFQLDESAREQDSVFYGLSLGATSALPLAPHPRLTLRHPRWEA